MTTWWKRSAWKMLPVLPNCRYRGSQAASKPPRDLPPYKWVLKERIRRAQALMAATATPIADIAAMAGFADQSHFTKAFRRVTGTTPRYWRTAR